ncbi:hypothetical protein [Chlorobaculum sp. 24CR]|uniref:hypothetical protein n=1 Tax=Chlorobaculum sp. 24CR TaxID=2508878 RepID=UPI0014304AC1|nr:hypothetical protein [Chlorobaculum sp. 24CR]
MVQVQALKNDFLEQGGIRERMTPMPGFRGEAPKGGGGSSLRFLACPFRPFCFFSLFF